jgi:hypothetical protein
MADARLSRDGVGKRRADMVNSTIRIRKAAIKVREPGSGVQKTLDLD